MGYLAHWQEKFKMVGLFGRIAGVELQRPNNLGATDCE